MKISTVLFLFIAQFSFADTYMFGTIKRDVVTLKNLKITVSKEALRGGRLRSAQIRSMLERLSMRRLQRDLRGGANAGALICEQQSGGVVVVGINTKSKNENSFCKIRANTLLDTGTLQFYAVMNDRSHYGSRPLNSQ